MNNNINVSSPNFGMAYRIKKTEGLIKYLNKSHPENLNKLNEKMIEAAKKLKNTNHADVITRASDDGKELIHSVYHDIPVFTKDGSLISYRDAERTSIDFNSLDEAINMALEKENKLTAAFKYAETQSELLKRLSS